MVTEVLMTDAVCHGNCMEYTKKAQEENHRKHLLPKGMKSFWMEIASQFGIENFCISGYER